MTPDQQSLYNMLTASPDAPVQFLVDTHYAEMAPRAQQVGIIKGDVGPRELFDAVIRSAANPNDFAFVMNVPVNPDNFPEGGYEVYMAAKHYWYELVNAPRLTMLRSQTTGGGSGGGGASGGGSNTGGVPSWLTGDTLSGAGDTVATIGNAIACWVDSTKCPGAQPAPGGTVIIQQPASEKTNYIPWIVGGFVVLIIAITVVVVVMRQK
jgi:hypothetical protein